jgi:hypothetical protein
MKHRSPLVTLAAAVLWFAALITTNFVIHPAAASGPGEYPAATPTGQSTGATASPSGSATIQPPSPSPSVTHPPGGLTSPKPGTQYPHKVVYAGRTKDGSVAVAVAVLGNQAAAYLCDGRTREAWLRGGVAQGNLSVRSRTGYELTAALHGTRLQGTLRFDSRVWRFEIPEAKPPAGIYRARSSGTTIGWIVLPDGTQVGVAGTTGGATSAAPPLDPGSGTTKLNGSQVSAEPVDGNTDV